MRNHHLHTKEFVVGAAVGSLLGGVAALLVAPKSGRKLRDDICDVYCNMSDRTQDFANRGKSFAKGLGGQTRGWASKARSAVDGARRTVRGWRGEEEEEETTSDFLIGGLVGGILGATAGLLLAPKSGDKLRRDLADAYEDISDRTQDFKEDMTRRGRSFAKNARSRTNKWINLAKDVVDGLTEESDESGEEWIERIKGVVNNKRINDAMDWAHLGYRIWQEVQAKR
jgi:gas vesicle protein